jgi:hypothetical protein
MSAQLPAAIPPLGMNWSTFGAEKTNYSLGGISSTVLKTARVNTAAATSFAFTGIAAIFNKTTTQLGSGAGAPLPNMSMLLESSTQKGMVAIKGTFLETGIAASFLYNKSFRADAASFTSIGAPGLSDFESDQVKGTYSFTGNPATLSKTFYGSVGTFTIPANTFTTFKRTGAGLTIMGGTVNTLSLSGISSNLIKNIKMPALNRVFNVLGQDNSWGKGKVSAPGSFTSTGQDVIFIKGVIQRRRVRIRFVTSQGAPISGPVTVEYAFFDQASPSDFSTPVEVGTAQIDANGFLDFEVEASALGAAQIGYLVVTNNINGNPELSWKEFSGPVRVI